MENDKFVAYYRVSTQRQGLSGLGLEAQRKAVMDYAGGVHAEIIAELTETESGRRATNRPKLQQALALCKRSKARLVIAKLDRLARNVHFISGLMESKIDFVALDNPHANKLTLHMLAAFAEHERDMISQRTKVALAAAKARGVKLGRGKELGALNSGLADKLALSIAPTIAELRQAGTVTLAGIADALNERGVLSSRGQHWHITSVHRLLRRIGRLQREQRRKAA